MTNMRTVLVTGASRRRGIAAAIARVLAREKWNIALTCWRPYDALMPWGNHPNEVEALVIELKALGATTTLYEDDLADPVAPTRIFNAIEPVVGPVDALVNAAAHSTRGGLLESTVADFDQHMAVNARGTLLMSAEFVRRFRGIPGTGRIVNLTSRLPLLGEIAYAASKGAIEWITIASVQSWLPQESPSMRSTQVPLIPDGCPPTCWHRCKLQALGGALGSRWMWLNWWRSCARSGQLGLLDKSCAVTEERVR